MAEKTAAPVKKVPVKKPAARKAPARKVAKGDAYSCEVCGLADIVDEICDCVEAHALICCDEPMNKKASKAKASKKK